MMTKPARRRSDNVVAMPSRDEATTSWEIDHGEIARRAYDIFCERGGEHGHDLDDWLRAERELREPVRTPAA
jgi:Protein of unknown function (DUF2934)